MGSFGGAQKAIIRCTAFSSVPQKRRTMKMRLESTFVNDSSIEVGHSQFTP